MRATKEDETEKMCCDQINNKSNKLQAMQAFTDI